MTLLFVTALLAAAATGADTQQHRESFLPPGKTEAAPRPGAPESALSFRQPLPAQPALPPVRVNVVAVQASRENRGLRYFERGLDDIRGAVADLEFDTYRKLSSATFPAAFNEETRFEISPKYTLCITPLSREPTGQVRLTVNVQLTSEHHRNKPVNALTTTLSIGRGKQVKLRGLKLDVGELVVLISLRGS